MKRRAFKEIVRIGLILRSIKTGVPVLCLLFAVLPGFLQAQEPQPAQPEQQRPVLPPAPNAKNPAVPDYPDPRSFAIGVFYWSLIPGSGPDVLGGTQATGYETLKALGKAKPTSPGIDISYPITRTGVLHLDAFVSKGDGNQTAPSDTTLFGASINKGDYLATQYQIRSGRLYLDDLMYPHKFPVAKFRLKSIWAIRYLGVKTTIDAPLQKDANGNLTNAAGTGSRQIVLPELGVAAEYGIARHVVLRVGGSGFGIPHHSNIWDGEATLAWRHGKVSVEGGVKALGFKTSPHKDEYTQDRLYGGFIGVRYHWQ